MIDILTWNWIGVIFTIFIAMYIINFAAWKLEDQLSIIWKKLKISPDIRWATFDAISSSLPEFLTAMIWLIILWEKWLEIWIWTISWSAIFNILIIPFCSLLVYKWSKIIVSKTAIKRDVLFYILAIIILLTGLYTGQLLITSLCLISLYISYLLRLYSSYKKSKNISWIKKEIEKEYLEVVNESVSIVTIIYSLILIYIAVEFSIHSAEFIWEALDIPTLIMALILLAWITSIPDTFLSIKASQKWDIDASLSNAVWSNIFDICIWLWLPILIWIWFMGLNPVVNFNENLTIFWFLFLSVVLYTCIMLSKIIKKGYWYYLLALYILFIGFLIYII